MIVASMPVGLPGLVVLTVGGIAFALALLAARRRGAGDPGQSQRRRRSWIGIAVQALGYVAVGLGPFRIIFDWRWPPGWLGALVVAVLMGGAIGLFVWSTRTMGSAWSLEARTRSDHRLATSGPFAYVRHPIYAAMALVLLAMAVAYGHYWQLLAGVPLLALGTWLRIRDEEALLRAQFGAEYDAWADRVKRFVPGIF